MATSMTHTPDEINEIRNDVRNQASAVCAIIKKAWGENCRDEDPVPVNLKIDYDGYNCRQWIERVVLKDAQEEVITISEEFHYLLRDAIRRDPEANAFGLISNLTDLAGHGAWTKDDGGGGEIIIDLTTGNVMSLDHQVRYVAIDYSCFTYQAAELMGEEPQGPQPG